MKQVNKGTDSHERRESRAVENFIFGMLRTLNECDAGSRSGKSKMQRVQVRPGSLLDRAGIKYYVEAQPRDAFGRFTFRTCHESVGIVADESEDRR